MPYILFFYDVTKLQNLNNKNNTCPPNTYMRADIAGSDGEFVDGVDEGFGRGGDDVGVGREAVVVLAVVFHGHMDLAHVVASLVDGLDEELLDEHLPADDDLDGVDGGVDRAVARGACLKPLSGYQQADGSHGAYAHARGHL